MRTEVTQPMVELTQVEKHFGGIKALRGVDLKIFPGQVLGLAGENGAGKSTLLKILTGIYQKDAGEIKYRDEVISHLTPHESKARGVAMVAQELSVIENLSVAENIVLGIEPKTKFGIVDQKKMCEQAEAALAEIGVNLSPHTMVRDLRFADRQLVEIAKALVSNPELLILDEPTSGLKEAEADKLCELILQLKEQGKAIIFITHRMHETFKVCDEILVLKDGQSMGQLKATETDAHELVNIMAGREVDTSFDHLKNHGKPVGEIILALDGFSVLGSRVRDIDMKVHAGEIFGLAGLAGQGQNDLLEGISGNRKSYGQLTLKGKRRRPFKSSREAFRAGVALAPEDRKRFGLVLEASILWNITLPTLRRYARAGLISRAKEREVGVLAAEQGGVTPYQPDAFAFGLSGGNQQKVVLAKTLLADPDVYIFADPTRGIDVRTKTEIYNLLRRLADAGKAVILYSTDLTEVVGLCDRVAVMSGGQIVKELAGSDISAESITMAAFS